MTSINKIELVQELEYLTNYEVLGKALINLSKKYKDEKLDICKGCLVDIGIYVAGLEQERKAFNKALSMYREDKIRAVERARKTEEINKELKEELTKFRKAKELGL